MFRTVAPRIAVEALVLVPDNTEVPARLGELQEDLLLDVVGVLVLVHEDVAEVAGHSVRGATVAEQVVHEPLQMGEVGAVGVEESPFVAAIRVADRRQERVGGGGELLGIGEFLSDLVEVTARSFDGRPAGLPFDEEEVVLRRPDDLVELLEDEEQLRELVEVYRSCGPARSGDGAA